MQIPAFLGRLFVLLLAMVAIEGQATPPPSAIRVVLDDNYPPWELTRPWRKSSAGAVLRMIRPSSMPA
jgi:hypothetical protein